MDGEILDENIFDHASEYEEKDFEFFRNYHSIEDAKLFTDLLDQNNIPYLASSSETIIDEAIVGSSLMPKVILKVLSKDFTKINKLIEEQILNSEHDFKDHYLNQLDNKELQEVFLKPDEWSIEDITVAKIILQNRGIKLTNEEVQDLRNNRLDEIRAGKTGSMFWMTLCFLGILSGLFIGIMFTIAGIGMGYYYGYGQSTDPDGVRYFVYDTNTRFYGKVILYVGCAVFIVELIFLFLN